VFDEQVLDATEAMVYLNVGRTFLTEHLADLGGSKLTAGKQGRLRFRRSLLDAFLERQRVRPADPTPTSLESERQQRRVTAPARKGTNPVTKKPWGYYDDLARQGEAAR
jgi:hypothetical protein